MEPKLATVHRIAGTAVLAVLIFAPVRPLRAEDDGARPGCGGACAHRKVNAGEEAIGIGGPAAERGRPAGRPVERGAPVPLRARSPGGTSKYPAVSTGRDTGPERTLEALDAAGGRPARTEANTAEPLISSRGIPIPTVHIGVLPRADPSHRSGLQKTFEVPGESEADANRRKILMHICATC